MATRDFTANQIRTAKVIMTGSAASGGVGHKNIELSVYSESVAPNQLGGNPTPSPYSAAGNDVSIFISGSQTSRGGSAGGVTLFHGDTFISGTLVVKNAGRTHGSISGSIQKMADGTDYIRVTGGLTATSGSDGSVTIDGSGVSGGGDVSLNYYDESNAANPFAPLAAGDQSVVIGTKSLASAGSEYTLIFGLNNTGSNTEMSNIAGGTDNKIYNLNDTSAYSRAITIAGGKNNVVTGSSSYSNIGGGKDNLITGSAAADDNAGYNTIAGGSNNKITGSQSTIGGGDQNETQSQFNTIAGGNQNKVETFSDFSFIGGGGSNISSGNSNSDNAHYAVIAGGQSNKIAATAGGSGGAPNSSILGGWLNKIQNSENSSILGGKNNLIDNNDSSMLLGQHLTSSAANQTILGYGNTFGGTGYVVASGSFFKSDGLSGGAITGSITRTKDDLSYLVAGANMTITSASNGQITLAASSGGESTHLHHMSTTANVATTQQYVHILTSGQRTTLSGEIVFVPPYAGKLKQVRFTDAGEANEVDSNIIFCMHKNYFPDNPSATTATDDGTGFALMHTTASLVTPHTMKTNNPLATFTGRQAVLIFGDGSSGTTVMSGTHGSNVTQGDLYAFSARAIGDTGVRSNLAMTLTFEFNSP